MCLLITRSISSIYRLGLSDVPIELGLCVFVETSVHVYVSICIHVIVLFCYPEKNKAAIMYFAPGPSKLRYRSDR
jgi:hypothetical protein